MSYAIFYPPQDTPEQIKREIEEQIRLASQTDPWLRENPPEITWIFNWPSFDVSIDGEFCRTVQRQVKQIRPEGGEFTGMFAVCDASFLFEKNIPVVVLGPGENKYTHSVEEKLSVEQLMEAVAMYALIIAEWCGLQDRT
jgi:Acetylornithine deacetylase/Succinyl-diaminopimelate desuccinylase and related deacylases